MRSTQNVELMKAFAAEMKARRGVLGVSQEELAQNQPSLTVMHRLAKGLEVDLPELIRLTLQRYDTEQRTKPAR